MSRIIMNYVYYCLAKWRSQTTMWTIYMIIETEYWWKLYWSWKVHTAQVCWVDDWSTIKLSVCYSYCPIPANFCFPLVMSFKVHPISCQIYTGRKSLKFVSLSHVPNSTFHCIQHILFEDVLPQIGSRNKGWDVA